MQTTNRPHQTKSSYSLLSALKLAVFASVLLIAFSSQVKAQFLSCGQLTISPFDDVGMVNSIGKTKDTIWVPDFLTTDSTMSVFSMPSKWDSSKLATITTKDEFIPDVIGVRSVTTLAV